MSKNITSALFFNGDYASIDSEKSGEDLVVTAKEKSGDITKVIFKEDRIVIKSKNPLTYNFGNFKD